MTKTEQKIYRSLTDKNYYRLSDKGIVQIHLEDDVWVNTDKDAEYLDRVCIRYVSVGGQKVGAKSTVTRRGWVARLLGRLRHGRS